jgi:hypothetical protein
MMLRFIKNLFVLLMVTLPLAGCFLPPVISFASLALDIGSFAVSGKSVTDHGLSAVAEEDCSLLRVFDGGVCQPYEDYEDDVSLAALEPLTPPEASSSEAPKGAGPGVLSDLGYIEAGMMPPRESGTLQVAARPATRWGARLIDGGEDRPFDLSDLY